MTTKNPPPSLIYNEILNSYIVYVNKIDRILKITTILITNTFRMNKQRNEISIKKHQDIYNTICKLNPDTCFLDKNK